MSQTDKAERESPTLDASRKCAEWLVVCLELGWSKSSLPFLEELWWKYHDNYGNLR